MDTVADWLSRAHTSHGLYRALVPARDYAGQAEHIRHALDARISAHDLDPQETDPAWAHDRLRNKGVPSTTLIAFYRAWLLRP